MSDYHRSYADQADLRIKELVQDVNHLTKECEARHLRVKELERLLDAECNDTLNQEGRIKELERENEELRKDLEFVLENFHKTEDKDHWEMFYHSLIPMREKHLKLGEDKEKA